MIPVTQDNVSRVIDLLTKAEIKKLKSAVTGYGKLKHNADKIGLPTQTLERIIKKGSGLTQNIAAIREKILGAGISNVEKDAVLEQAQN